MIQEVYGDKVKYSKQATSLAAAISSKCKCRISATTVKRLFGFIPGTETARLWTLDIIACYCNYESWDDLVADIVESDVKKTSEIEMVVSKKLKHGVRLKISFGKIPCIDIEYLGKNHFRLLQQEKTTLLAGDILEITKVELNLPLLVKKIQRDEVVHSSTIVGSITGVTHIRLITKNQIP